MSTSFLPTGVLDQVTDFRVRHPAHIEDLLLARARSSRAWPKDGRLNLLAADHPARGVTGVGHAPLAMANRHDYLSRTLRIVAGGGVDGVMATMDILEDLLILDHLVTEAGGASFLDDKLLVPSLNRGGLYGSAWELHDPITGATPDSCARWGMDGAKLLLRVCAEVPDSLKTLQICADAVSRLAQLNVPCFLEPLPVERAGELFFNVTKEAGALAQLVGVATALGESSRGLWLKLPWCPDFEIVAQSTTLPILLLGGPATGDAAGLLEQIRSGLAAGSNVRGALVGRNVLYPGTSDPLAAARAVHGLIHQDKSLDEALQTMQESKEDEWVHADAPWHRL